MEGYLISAFYQGFRFVWFDALSFLKSMQFLLSGKRNQAGAGFDAALGFLVVSVKLSDFYKPILGYHSLLIWINTGDWEWLKSKWTIKIVDLKKNGSLLIEKGYRPQIPVFNS